MRLTLRIITLPLRHVFRTAHAAATSQQSLLVELAEGDYCGYGEGAAPSYAGVTADMMRDDLENLRGSIESASFETPESLWNTFQPLLTKNPFALAALDEAAHDLWGKRRGQPVYRLWGLALDRLPLSNYTIGIDRLDTMIGKMQEYHDWPIYKIKLGTADDIQIVRELRQHSRAVFRVDANCGWSADQTIAYSGPLRELGVEFIEQPLPADDWSGMQRVFRESALPVIADESCQTEQDVERCHGCFHGINIKLAKCGGMTPARRMIARSRELGLQVMMGCMTESTVGISAIGQFLPLLDYVDMDGAELLADDIASGVRLIRGRAAFPPENGNGVRLLTP